MHLTSTNFDHSTLTVATVWVEQLLLGSLGTSVAILAVSGVGFAWLQGYIAARDAVRVIAGSFILFGAPLIAQGIFKSLRSPPSTSVEISAPLQSMPTPLAPAPKPTTPQSAQYNPFDAAAVTH